jgi:hypothetical protein
MVNWRAVFNRLWVIINAAGPGYFSGPRFLDKVREFDLDTPTYAEFLALRNEACRSTSRKDYFYDVLMDLNEQSRVRVVNSIIDEVGNTNADMAAQIRDLLGGAAAVPNAVVPAEAWNADRLNEHLATIDAAIGAGTYDRAVTLCYTCLEGFYKAFSRAKNNGEEPSNELIDLAKWIRNHLRAELAEYPDEVMAQITTTAHVIDRARNRFSEAHFQGEAARWLAVYIRDLLNTQIRLLLHFW